MILRRNFKAAICGLVLGCFLTLPVLGYISHLEKNPAHFVDVIGQNRVHFDAKPAVDPIKSFRRLDAYVLLAKYAGVELDSRYEYLFALFVLAIAGFCIFWKSGAVGNKQGVGFSWSNCLMLLTMLVAIYHQTYDWLLVALPLTGLIVGQPAAIGGGRPLARYSMIGLLLVPAANYAASETGSRFFDPHGLAWSLISSANSAALLTAWLISLYCLVRSPTLDESVEPPVTVSPRV